MRRIAHRTACVKIDETRKPSKRPRRAVRGRQQAHLHGEGRDRRAQFECASRVVQPGISQGLVRLPEPRIMKRWWPLSGPVEAKINASSTMKYRKRRGPVLRLMNFTSSPLNEGGARIVAKDVSQFPAQPIHRADVERRLSGPVSLRLDRQDVPASRPHGFTISPSSRHLPTRYAAWNG